MPETENLMLAVWREVSRHLEINESAESIAALLAGHLPVGRLLVRRVDADQRRLRTVAAAPPGEGSREPGEVQFTTGDWQRLDRWLRKNAAASGESASRGDRSLLELLHRAPVEADWFLAPLAGEHGSRGVLTVFAGGGHRFSAAHVGLLEATREAVAAALDNDVRLHEVASLREAAEADRRSLLSRLGRKEVGDVIVGDASGLRQVMERADMVSRSDVPVLILGETGTGKELVARAIHNRSHRHNGPFIRVNCGAIPRELIDSQLFGHERGAFTGATEPRQGWFERADGGTLFLDEIGELPLDAQVRFLRVLQDGIIERIGGTKSIAVNVRVVAATHRDLAGMVRESSFREDLWYRIAVFPILLPPLRERVEDIPALANHFAQRAAVRFGLSLVLPSESDFDLLAQYDWPGNIRELGTVIDRAAILGNGQTLEIAAALGPATPRRMTDSPLAGRHPSEGVRQPGSQFPSLEQAMMAHITAALRATQGRVEGPQGAATLLDINPHTLRARMRKLGIDWTTFRKSGPWP